MFVVGNLYSRSEDIHGRFGGQMRGGIATPANAPYVFLFTGESGESFGYSDGWAKGEAVFRYTGEGQVGPMKFKMGNKAIRDHALNGRDLLVFQSLGKSKPYRYLGRFACQDWEIVQAPDRNGQLREAIVFLLASLDKDESGTESNLGQDEEDLSNQEIIDIDLEQLRRLAYLAPSPRLSGKAKHAERNVYQRASSVKRYVLKRAKGVCEACKSPAPFARRSGAPYLEPHHLRRVSDGGPDHPRWVAALCPNCHREAHFGLQGAELNMRLDAQLESLEVEWRALTNSIDLGSDESQKT